MAERKIAGETYRADPLPAGKAIELLLDLVRIASVAIPRLPGVVDILNAKAAASLAASASAEPNDDAEPSADRGDSAAAAQAALLASENALDAAKVAIMGDIIAETPSEHLRSVLERVVAGASVQRPSGYASIVFDDDFTNNLAALPPVAAFVIETNYGALLAPLAKTELGRAFRAAVA